MNITTQRELIKTNLESTLEVTNWDSVNFGILPNENSKGFISFGKLEKVDNSLSKSTWLVGVAVSNVSLEGLYTEALGIIQSAYDLFSNPTTCFSGLGNTQLASEINMEIPQSYAQQSNISSTNGWFTAITFAIEITG
jgi:hypothetical protein